MHRAVSDDLDFVEISSIFSYCDEIATKYSVTKPLFSCGKSTRWLKIMFLWYECYRILETENMSEKLKVEFGYDIHGRRSGFSWFSGNFLYFMDRNEDTEEQDRILRLYIINKLLLCCCYQKCNGWTRNSFSMWIQGSPNRLVCNWMTIHESWEGWMCWFLRCECECYGSHNYIVV